MLFAATLKRKKKSCYIHQLPRSGGVCSGQRLSVAAGRDGIISGLCHYSQMSNLALEWCSKDHQSIILQQQQSGHVRKCVCVSEYGCIAPN